ncbi:MAG: hypothetical protein ACI9UA_001963, partial [Pseudoalteromonas tetraodonis]
TDFDVRTAESIALNFRFAFGFAGVNATAAPEGIRISMENPGAPAAVDAGGNFSQLQNEVRLIGTVSVEGTGLAAGAVPEGDQIFDQAGNFLDLNGTITQSGSTLTLSTPIEFAGVFDLDGNSLGLDLTGDLVATSPVQTSELSAPTTVTINVSAVNDSPSIQNDQYFTDAGSPLLVPVTIPDGGSQSLVASGAIWKYLANGSDLGSAWSAPEFDDASWDEGASQLGYGDTETTLVGFGDENNKHITTYFRHQFNVPDPEAQADLCLRLKRDDGAAVYLNGVEIARSNLPPAAGSSTLASSTVDGRAEEHFYEWCLPSGLLVSGSNTLAVEAHQASVTSSDLIFDLELIRNRTFGGVLANDSDTDGDTLSASVHTPPTNGILILAPDGSFTYTPAVGFVGTDSFIYQAQDIEELVDRALIPLGDDWKFLDDGSNQGTAWSEIGFDDSGWASGPGELGYGDAPDDQATIVSFGLDQNNKFATTYFRNHFFLGNVAELSDAVEFQLVRDDAAAIYINGTEIYRDDNLVGGAMFNTFAVPAVANEDEVVTATVPLGVLVDGRNTIAVEVHQSSGTSSDLAFHLALTCPTPAETPILPLGSTWKYAASGDDLGTAWTDAEFDDSLWVSGAGELGYGDGDETTALPVPADPKPLTVYFRSRLHIPDASQVQTLAIDLIRDDGAAVYINGTEIVRDNLATAAAFDTPASAGVNGDSESKLRPFIKIDPTLLQDGENIIAVEIHQINDTSSDLSFDMAVRASLIKSLGIATINVIGIPSVDSDNDGIDDNWETANGLVVGSDDSLLDPDGDGRSNLEEFLALTNPQDPASLLKIIAVSQAPNADLTVSFASTVGKTYQLQHSTDLSGFTDIGAPLTATGLESTLNAPSLSTLKGFLRVRVLP